MGSRFRWLGWEGGVVLFDYVSLLALVAGCCECV